MRKLGVWMAAAFLAGAAGMARADTAEGTNQVNPQFLPPGAKPPVAGNRSGNGEDALNPQPYPLQGKTVNANNEHKVGKEVLVGFEDGNPDRPITTGQGGNGIYYYFKHQDSGNTIITGPVNNKAVTTGVVQGSPNAKGGKSYKKGSLIVVKDGKKGAKTAVKNSIPNGIKSLPGGGTGKSINAGLNFTRDAKGFQKANGALNGNLHNNAAMGNGSMRGQ